METSRRSLFAFVGQSLVVLAAAGSVVMLRDRANPAFPFPRGTLVPMVTRVVNGKVCFDVDSPCVEQISTGEKLVPLASPEGQAALKMRMALPEEPWPAYPRGKTLGRWVSTGNDFVLRQSEEGKAIRWWLG